VTIVGTLIPLSAGDVDALNQEYDRLQGQIETMDFWQTTAFIFTNNFLISLVMFIPIVGFGFGFYVLFNTGVILNAVSTARGFSPVLTFLLLFIFPHAWLEFIAYSIALSESGWVIWQVFHRNIKSELIKMLKLFLISTGLLLLGAVVESILIFSFP
jgi:uncharacterized membrane protein SpoIIM required for sporulation